MQPVIPNSGIGVWLKKTTLGAIERERWETEKVTISLRGSYQLAVRHLLKRVVNHLVARIA